MIIKSLLEIAFYSSLLVAKKIGSTIEENIPFVQNKKEKVQIAPKKVIKVNSKSEKDEDNQVSKTEKGAKPKLEEKEKVDQKPTIKKEEKDKTESIAKKETTTKKVEAKEETKLGYSNKTKKELYEIAQEIDLEGRSTLNKAQLLKALKNHSKK